MIKNASIDHIAWARKLNGRWIVHNKLNDTAAAYMDYVAEADHGRLARSCRLAHLLVHALEPTEDPKPWFYGGLFSLATRSEASTFLAPHPLLASVVPALQKQDRTATLGSVDEVTRRKILRLRDALRRITKETTG